MKFQKGSLVTVKKGLIIGVKYGRGYYTSELNTFVGKKMKVIAYDHGDNTYLLDKTGFWVAEEMLEQTSEN